MRRYLIRRLLASVVTIIGATFVVFALSRVAGDPLLLYANPEGYGRTPEQIRALEKHLGLDKPFIVQYLVWVGHTLQGDLGQSLAGERKVSKVILEKVGATTQLAIAGWALATFCGGADRDNIGSLSRDDMGLCRAVCGVVRAGDTELLAGYCDGFVVLSVAGVVAEWIARREF